MRRAELAAAGGVDRLSVQRERARITRDLHDIVSHHLALIVIQAAAGRLAEPWHGEVAAGRFATIREAGAEALAETDRLVTLLQPDRSEPKPYDLVTLESVAISGWRDRAVPVARPESTSR